MSKVICDICGTTYQDTADQCPICGCSRDAAAALFGDDLLTEEVAEESKARAGKFSSRKKEIFDFDEVNSEMDDEEVDEEPYDEDEEDDEEDYEEEPRHNTFVVILLTVLIFALLAVAGFLFVRYFLPNMSSEETVPTTEAQIEETAEATTQPGIPCQNLVMTSGGTAELNQEGQYFLLHVIAMPEDTTDTIIYTSADESIATVTEDGRITAVSEGETEIYITCGSSQLVCPVICKFVEETVPPTEETSAETEAQIDDGESEEESDGEETTEETSRAVDPNVVLKLKKTDIMLGVYYQFTLELDCDLEPTDVEWSSEHPHIATVDENGTVTAQKDGTTAIIAKYGDQEVQCIVRCGF